MRKVIITLLVVAVIAAGVSVLKRAATENALQKTGDVQSVAMKQTEFSTVGYADTFNVIEEKTTVKRGGSGSIALSGDSGESFTIKTTYIKGAEMISVKKTIIADEKGIAIFRWDVSKDSVPGTYPIIITGNSSSLRLFHTVL